MFGIRSVEGNPSRGFARGLALLVLVGGLLAVAFILRAADAPAEKPIDGHWQGKLKVSGIELRLVFHFSRDKDGKLTATFDSPDQGAKAIATDSVTLDGATVNVEAKKLLAAFTGTLSDDGSRLKGEWKQSGQSLPLELARLDKEPDYRRPQDPQKPYPYDDEEVSYKNAADGVKLAATLTLPKSPRPAPAVVLITGSGPQDRDESLLGHKPFLVLADYLSRHGIAVLRADDRGVGGSTGSSFAATTENLAGDALAAVDYLKTRSEIDPRHIGLVGHSEGGIIAPLAASRSADVAFIVLLAGTGVDGEQILLHQGELIAAADGADKEASSDSRALQTQLVKIIKSQPDNAAAEEQFRQAIADSAALAAIEKPETRKSTQTQVEAQSKIMLTPWFRFFLSYDPQVALRKVRCPVLAINGEKDLQVDPKQNLPPIVAALKEAGNEDVTVRELAGLNHLFQHCKSGSPAEYGKIDETFAPEALEIVAGWIAEKSK